MDEHGPMATSNNDEITGWGTNMDAREGADGGVEEADEGDRRTAHKSDGEMLEAAGLWF